MARRHTMADKATGPQTHTGTQGTLGGIRSAIGNPGRRTAQFGDEVYLWILVTIEMLAIVWLRSAFSRYHGG